ncbi:putative ADP-ribosylation factor-like protein 5C isoform X4 [Panthera tigris]|uniref:putative ADP-ribosylation factor-like protein 5C isoform X4 n=1 Tax=Panthera tigris TaxID=9694 RepID=UPI001C6F648A|nr:putative ADP-ribosylation factor-like protein 5C isoform X4 [Panthera tigris]
MGLLIAKLMSIFANQEHKVIIVGLDNAGKTTILYQFLMNEVVHTSPTIGSNVEEIILQKTHFLMWDIGGQEALRSTWNTYYSNTEVEKGIKMQRGSESLRPDQFSVGLTSGWCRDWSGSTVGRRHAHQRKSPPLTVPLCWPVHHPCD